MQTSAARPFVFINVAVTADGKMDTSARKGAGISSEADKLRVMQLRAGADAVMVGGHTLIEEDPKLTVKPAELRQERLAKNLPENPIKVGVSSQALPDPQGSFMNAGPAQRILFTTSRADPAHVQALTARGAQVFVLGETRVDLALACQRLHELGVRRLMVEGGGTLNFEMLRLSLVDEISLYLAPKIFGGHSAPTLADGAGLTGTEGLSLRLIDTTILDETGGVLIRYRVLPTLPIELS